MRPLNKELFEAGEKLIADHKRKLEERVQSLLERCEPYESIDDILIKKYGLTQEQIDNYQFPDYREEYEAEIERFLNEEF